MTLKPKTQKAVRTGLWLLLDAVLINLAMILSQVLRYTTTISYSFFQIYFRIAPAMTLMGLILFAVFGLYRTMWQYASAEDLLRVVLSTLALAVCTYLYSVIANYFVRPQNLFRLHRLIYPLFWLISMALVGFPSTDNAGSTLITHINDVGNIRYEMGYACSIATVLFLMMLLVNAAVRKLLNRYLD